MSRKINMCILLWDETADIVFIDRSVLGTQIKFMERLPRDETLFEAIAERMAESEKTPSRVMLCIPRTAAIQRTLSYPAAVAADLDNMIRFEATRHIPLPEDDRMLAWASADSPDEKQIVLNLVATRKAEVRELVGYFEDAGIPVDEAVPFSSLVGPTLGDVPTLLVLADSQHFELSLYGQGMLQDSQVISKKEPGFRDGRVSMAARQMVAKHKEWLGDEGVGRILTGGPEPLPRDLKEDLATAFGLHVHSLDAPEETAGFVADEVLVDALLAASIEAPPTLNLLEDRQRKVPIRKRTLVIAGLSLLLVLESLVVIGLKTDAPALQRRKIAREIEEMRQQTASTQEMKSKNRIFRKQLYQLEQVCGTRASSMEIMQKVSDALPEDAYLRQFSCDNEEISLRGFSKEPDKLPELVMALPFVDTINRSEIGRKNGDYYEFTLEARLRR